LKTTKNYQQPFLKAQDFRRAKTKGRRYKKAENNPQFCLRPLRLLM